MEYVYFHGMSYFRRKGELLSLLNCFSTEKVVELWTEITLDHLFTVGSHTQSHPQAMHVTLVRVHGI